MLEAKNGVAGMIFVKEEKQKRLRKLKELMESPEETNFDPKTKEFIETEDMSESRRLRFKELMAVSTTRDFSDRQIRQWIWYMNKYMILMSELNYKFKNREVEEVKKSQAQKYLDGDLKDRQSQTPTHYDRTASPARYVQLPWNQHGAWLYSDDFYPHRD